MTKEKMTQEEVLKQLKEELDVMAQGYVGHVFNRNEIKADVRAFLEGHRLDLPTPYYDILIGIDSVNGSAKVAVQFYIDPPPLTAVQACL